MNETQLEKSLDFLGHDHRHLILDSLFATFHNTWATLEGNTEQGDVEWLAERIWAKEHSHHTINIFRTMSLEEKGPYLDLAVLCLSCLPDIAARISNRWKIIRDVLETEMKADRERLRELYKAQKREDA